MAWLLALLLLAPAQIEIRARGRLLTPVAPAVRPNILFIGNSLTYFNEMPWMVGEVAKSKNVPVGTTFVGRSGFSLRQHWDEGKAVAEIRTRRYDYVVLQPQSTEIISRPDETAQYARLFNGEIRKSGAKTVLFLTFAPRGYVKQSQFNARYIALAKELKMMVAPVGIAWERLQKLGIDLFQDDVHPNVAGSYLAACVFFAIATGRTPEDATYTFDVHYDIPEIYRKSLEEDRIHPSTAAAIQREAWRAVQEFKPPR